MNANWKPDRYCGVKVNCKMKNGTCPTLYLEKDGKLGEDQGTWDFAKEDQSLQLTLNGEVVRNLIVFAGHDWENETETVLFTGLDSRGRSVWGKRTK